MRRCEIVTIDQHTAGPILIGTILFVALAPLALYMWCLLNKGSKQRTANHAALRLLREKCCETLAAEWKKQGADLDGWDYTVATNGEVSYHPYKLVDGKKVRIPNPKERPKT